MSYTITTSAANKSPLPIQTPTLLAIAAPSFSGKTCLVSKLIEHRVFCIDQPVRSIKYFYSIFQDKYDEIERANPIVTFHKGLPTHAQIDEVSDPNHLDMLVLDDLGEVVGNSEFLLEMATFGVHHKNVILVNVVHDLFGNGRHRKTQSASTHLWCLLRNRSSPNQILTFAQQRFPGRVRNFLEAYRDATSVPYGFLFVNLHPHGDELFTVRSGIFHDEQMVIYDIKMEG